MLVRILLLKRLLLLVRARLLACRFLPLRLLLQLGLGKLLLLLSASLLQPIIHLLMKNCRLMQQVVDSRLLLLLLLLLIGIHLLRPPWCLKLWQLLV